MNETEKHTLWTQDEFQKFIDCIVDNPMSYAAFSLFYWCGLRIEELLALTVQDIHYENNSVSITKTYNERTGTYFTPKMGNRRVEIPKCAMDAVISYAQSIKIENRLFPVTKLFLDSELKRGIQKSGAREIRLYDLRTCYLEQQMSKKNRLVF